MLPYATGIEFINIAYKGGMPEAFGALIEVRAPASAYSTLTPACCTTLRQRSMSDLIKA